MKTNGWQQRQLGELAELRGRIGWRGLTAKEYKKDGPLFLSVHSLNYGDYVDFRNAFHISQERYDESPEIMLREGDVLICKDGAGIGKLGIVGELPWGDDDKLVASDDSEWQRDFPKFLYHCLCSPYFQDIVQSRLQGATTPHLYQRDITEFPVVLPPLPEQRRIVGILDEAFAGIATAKANAEKNLRSAGELFESVLQSTFDRLGQLCARQQLVGMCEPDRVITYGVIKLGEETTDGVPCLRTSNVRWLRIDIDGMKRITKSLSDEFRRTILRGGEVLVNVRGTLGGVSVVAPEMSGWNVSREVAMVPCDAARIDPYYLAYWIGTEESQAWLGGVKKGAAYVGINIEDLRLLPVPLPKLAEQRSVVVKLDEIRLEIQRLASLYEQELAALDALKKSLLHQAFSGKLRERTVELKPVVVEQPLLRITGMSSNELHALVLIKSYRLHKAQGNLSEFGHVKAEKTAHLIEYHFGIDLERLPVKAAAGPNDFPHFHRMIYRAEHAGWFKFDEKVGSTFVFEPLKKIDKVPSRAALLLGDLEFKIDAFLKLLLPLTWREAEVIATVYAGNNLLIDGKSPTDEEIVYESRENWHPEKLKIARHLFFEALEWLRKEGVIPVGKGKRVD